MILNAVYHLLRMLHPYPHCKGFIFKLHPTTVQYNIYVTCGMTRGKYYVIRFKQFIAVYCHTPEGATLNSYICYPASEHDNASCSCDGLMHCVYDARESVSTQVWMSFEQYRRISAVENKKLKHPPVVTSLF